jgi:hypothetical protein
MEHKSALDKMASINLTPGTERDKWKLPQWITWLSKNTASYLHCKHTWHDVPDGAQYVYQLSKLHLNHTRRCIHQCTHRLVWQEKWITKSNPWLYFGKRKEKKLLSQLAHISYSENILRVCELEGTNKMSGTQPKYLHHII